MHSTTIVSIYKEITQQWHILLWLYIMYVMGSLLFQSDFSTIILCSLYKSKTHYGCISGEKLDMKEAKKFSPKSDSKVRNAKPLKAALFTL